MIIGELPVVRPFPWAHLLRYLGRRFTPGIEQVTQDSYVRRVDRELVTVQFEPDAARLRVTATGALDNADILQRVAALFDVTHDSHPIEKHLRAFDLLRARIDLVPGMRPAGAWSPFELCVRTIVGQQVTVAAAGTLMQRLVDRCGAITAPCVIAANLEQLGMPGKRVESIRGLARTVAEDRIRFTEPWSQLEAALATLPGFGPWTRAYLGIRLGRDADAFASSDLGLMRAAGADSPAALLRLAEPWRPYRAHAATLLWSVDLPS